MEQDEQSVEQPVVVAQLAKTVITPPGQTVSMCVFVLVSLTKIVGLWKCLTRNFSQSTVSTSKSN